MRVSCHTTLDVFNEAWPTELAAVPRVGDYVQSATKWKDGFQLELIVVSVRWIAEGVRGTTQPYWYPSIELHLPPNNRWESIKAFFEWYAPKVGKRVTWFI